MSRLLALALVLTTLGPAAWAAGPPTVNYQGVLRSATDAPLSGTYDMTFRFMDAASGGTEILVDRHQASSGNAVTVSGGLFNVELGGGTIADGSGPGSYLSLDGVFRDYGTVWLEVVIGVDDRVPLGDDLIRTNPWRQICALRIQSSTGVAYVGTGWFIGPSVLATAGHCVFLRDDGGWAASIDVIPGLAGTIEPYGRATATRFASVTGWRDSGSGDFDYGVIFLDDPGLGSRVGNFAVETETDADLTGALSRISGYPYDLEEATRQYYHERPLKSVTPTRLKYDIDTFGGQSGSPIWQQTTELGLIAVGIHTTGGVSSNSGTRINQDVLDNLATWTRE